MKFGQRINNKSEIPARRVQRVLLRSASRIARNKIDCGQNWEKNNNDASFTRIGRVKDAMDEEEHRLKRRRAIPTIAASPSPPASDFQLELERATRPSEEEVARRLAEEAETARVQAEEAELEERQNTWTEFADEYYDSERSRNDRDDTADSLYSRARAPA